MKRNPALGLIFAGMISMCHTSLSDVSNAAPKSANERAAIRNDEALYCTKGHVYVKRTGGGFTEVAIDTTIRKSTPSLLQSIDTDFFKIYKPNCTEVDVQPDRKVCINKDDKIQIEYKDSKYHLEQRRGDSLVAKGTLTADRSGLWAEGPAYKAGSALPTGTFAIYARPMQRPCRHAGTPLNRECRSILVEYFAEGDEYAQRDRPTYDTSAATVRAGACRLSGTGLETGDGEGDHGPIKP